MIILSSIAKLVDAYQAYVERTSALRQLKRLSPRELADIGIEPYELEVGVIGFPWKNKGSVQNKQTVAPVQTTVNSEKSFAGTMITLYSAWGRPVRNW